MPRSKPPDFDLQQFLPFLLTQAAEASAARFQRLYKDRYGLLRTDWRVLFHLGLHGPMTATQIGHRARTHKTKISRAVHRLAQRRYLSRSRDTGDRRVEHLALTVAGQSVYRDLHAAARDYDAHLTQGFSPTEVAQLRRVLRQLADQA